ncbi:MAG: hypothetical protein V1778_01290 [bacterium]
MRAQYRQIILSAIVKELKRHPRALQGFLSIPPSHQDEFLRYILA